MTHFFSTLRQTYGDLKLQSKIVIVLILSGCVPLLIIGLLFYSQLNDMVVSYTIRQEQDTSAKTAPLIEQTVQEVLDTYDNVCEQPFYHSLFTRPVNMTLSSYARSDEASDFQKVISGLTSQPLITAIKIYVDFPNGNSELFHHDNTGDIFSPASTIRGTYWYGIFQGSRVTDLHCPSFYLGAKEQAENGDTAYIHKTYLKYHEEPLPCYVAVYYSSQVLTDILSENLQLDGSVSYITNERNALVASSNRSLSGIYWLDYDTIRESFMSSNNFIERTILDNKIYAGFYRINKPGWFMVTVLPSQPLIEQSNQPPAFQQSC